MQRHPPRADPAGVAASAASKISVQPDESIDRRTHSRIALPRSYANRDRAESATACETVDSGRCRRGRIRYEAPREMAARNEMPWFAEVLVANSAARELVWLHIDSAQQPTGDDPRLLPSPCNGVDQAVARGSTVRRGSSRGQVYRSLNKHLGDGGCQVAQRLTPRLWKEIFAQDPFLFAARPATEECRSVTACERNGDHLPPTAGSARCRDGRPRAT